jgi:hypothetical protein
VQLVAKFLLQRHSNSKKGNTKKSRPFTYSVSFDCSDCKQAYSETKWNFKRWICLLSIDITSSSRIFKKIIYTVDWYHTIGQSPLSAVYVTDKTFREIAIFSSSALKMERVCCSETIMSIDQSTRRYNREQHRCLHLHEKLKSLISYCFSTE